MSFKYELVAEGCATDWSECPHGGDAVTVYRLNAAGRQMPGGTLCVHRSEFERVQSEPTWCPIHQHYKWCEHNGGMMGPSGYERIP